MFAVFFNNRIGRITSLANPFFWIFRLIAAAIGPWGEEIMRWHEYQADIAAGRMYGSDAVVSGQQNGLINSFAFEMALEKCKRWLENGKMRVDDIIGYAGRIRDAMNDTDRRQILAREEVLIGRFDGTHPSPALRAEAVEKFACKVSEDCRPAMEAVRDAPRLTSELTDRVYKFFDDRFEIKVASPKIVKWDELPLSYTESELGNILDKFVHESGKKGLSVTYDLDGLKRADRFFAAHPEFFKVPPEKDIIGDLILYFGETIRRMHGGEWVFPVVAPPRLKEVGPHKLNLEVFEIFMSELAASHYPATHPAYIRAIDRLGIKESSDITPKPPGPVV